MKASQRLLSLMDQYATLDTSEELSDVLNDPTASAPEVIAATHAFATELNRVEGAGIDVEKFVDNNIIQINPNIYDEESFDDTGHFDESFEFTDDDDTELIDPFDDIDLLPIHDE